MKIILVSVFALLVLMVLTADGDDIPAPPPTTLASTQKEILDAINNCRRNVNPTATNMLQVEWYKAAQVTAQKYAETCRMVHSTADERRPNDTNCGENLYMASYGASWTEAINAFCNEKQYFTYGKGPNNPGDVVGHYTEVVWYNSYQVGCGVGYCPNDPKYKYFYVCHHCPAGNIAGQTSTPYKKGPSCGDCLSNCKDNLCTNPCRYPANVFSNCNDLKDYCPYDTNVIKNCKSSCNCKNNEIV